MRVLILTGPESESQGAVSRALKRAFSAREDSCLIVSALALIGPHPSLSQTRAMEQALVSPRGFAFLSAGASFLRTGKPKTPVYEVNARYAEHLRTLITEGEFDALLCLHRYPAEAVSHIRKSLAFSARCCFVSCDYATVPFLEETRLDHYFTPHGSIVSAYESRGLPANKLLQAGIPLPADWFRAEDMEDARALLNLPQQMPCYFIPYASDPVKAVEALLKSLPGENGRVCVLAPDGAPPKSPFVARFSGDVRVVVVDDQDPLALYWAACDVMLASPSGPLSAAAAVLSMPLVHLPATDAFEAQTAQFFSSRGMSLSGESEVDCAQLAVSLASSISRRESMRLMQQSENQAAGAQQIVRFLHEGRLQ